MSREAYNKALLQHVCDGEEHWVFGTPIYTQVSPEAPGPDKIYTVYVLLLQDGYFYVGKTASDFSQHVKTYFNTSGNFTGIDWLSLHPPVKPLFYCYTQNPSYDKNVFLSLVGMYGLDKIRGYTYTNIRLTEREKQKIKDEFGKMI